jgi:hypothetical protein
MVTAGAPMQADKRQSDETLAAKTSEAGSGWFWFAPKMLRAQA